MVVEGDIFRLGGVLTSSCLTISGCIFLVVGLMAAGLRSQDGVRRCGR